MKHAVVIGGTRGIGEGVVSILLREGWKITATGVGQDEVAAFQDRYPDAYAQVLDVTDQDRITQVFAGLDSLAGLVNCAGILLREQEYDITVFARVIDINLTGTMRCCLAARPLLAKTGGGLSLTPRPCSAISAGRWYPPTRPRKVGWHN